MTPTHLPGSRWLDRLRNPILRVGVPTGVYLTLVMVFALLLANRVPWLERFAWIRNGVCFMVFGLVMLIPVWSFRRAPRHLFAAGVLGWFLFSVAYAIVGNFLFDNLFGWLDKTPTQMFVRGGILYGIMAVVIWISLLLLELRHHPMTHSRHHHF